VVPSGLYVAVIDDDCAVRRALARLLAEVGFAVRTFGSAEEFLETLPADAPACLVLDVHLPASTGFALLESLRRAGHSFAVVFITADHEIAQSEQLRRTGAPCLRKPIDATALFNVIRELTETGP
jgi:FixJ family two-component response regulator